jgi:hypothetical protein
VVGAGVVHPRLAAGIPDLGPNPHVLPRPVLGPPLPVTVTGPVGARAGAPAGVVVVVEVVVGAVVVAGLGWVLVGGE